MSCPDAYVSCELSAHPQRTLFDTLESSGDKHHHPVCQYRAYCAGPSVSPLFMVSVLDRLPQAARKLP